MGGHADPRLDALEDIRCDEMEREERREAREDQERAEDRQERAEDRRAALVALSANGVHQLLNEWGWSRTDGVVPITMEGVGLDVDAGRQGRQVLAGPRTARPGRRTTPAGRTACYP